MALLRRGSRSQEAETPVTARGRGEPTAFIPARAERPLVESVFMRLTATGGIVGIGTALAAILGSQEVDAWIIGIVVSGLSVILAAVLWSSRLL